MSRDGEDALCRYCLESDGILISPCECKGSGGSVHQSCFRTWYRIQLDQGVPLRCPVCDSPYATEFCPVYELIPSSRTVSCFLLHNPYILSLFVYYGQVVHVAFLREYRGAFDPLYLQTILHAIYFAMFLKAASVKNWRLYLQQVGLYYQILIVSKVFLWTRVVHGDTLAMSLNTVLLAGYWRIHLRGLESVNAALTGS
jgi:hypothetical protein